MEGYLGEFPVNIEESEFKHYTKADWALLYIGMYGGIDGDHHKTWVLDQASRLLNGMKMIVVEARWENGQTEFRFNVEEEESFEYVKWVKELKDGEDGPDTYGYEEGIAP